jgi:hypothetical protein
MDDMSARYCLAAPPRPSRRWLQLGALGTVLAGVCFGAVLAPDASASKRPALGYVSGRLSVSGYTVALVGYNGRAAFSRQRSFRVRAPDSKLTVQLISKHGVYAGPVVFSSTATRAIVGIKAGTNLGNITVVASKGYAHVTRKLAAKSLDGGRWAYAKQGVPIGNGKNLGLVLSKSKGSAVGAGRDPARIGIPNEFNIALPGTRVLKSLSPGAKAQRAVMTARSAISAVACPPPPAALPPGCTPGGGPSNSSASASVSPWSSQLFLPIEQTINADAAGITKAEIDATLQAKLDLLLTQVPSGNLVELNCNGLSFCSRGGSGQAQMEGLSQTSSGPQLSAFGYYQLTAFPSGSLDGASGFGELVGPDVPHGLLGSDPGGGQEFNLDPRATSSQIGSGDVATELVTNNGTTTQVPLTIGFVFNTVPALASYSDSAGGSGTLSYPDVTGAGTVQHPLLVAAGADGDVVVRFTVLRPQRTGVAGAGESAFEDIGHLGYTIGFGNGGPAGGAGLHLVNTLGGSCSTGSYSGLAASLSLGSGGGGFGPVSGTSWLTDSSADEPANAQSTLSFTVNLSECLTDAGNPGFPVGQPVGLSLQAASQSSADQAVQTFYVQRTS